MRHLGVSRENVKDLHKLSKCCRWWCGCCRVCLWLHNRRNLQFSHSVLHICLMEVVGRVPTSRLHWFVKPHLLLPKALHVVLYCFGDCAHHPARFIIFAQLAKLCIFLIMILVFPILHILETCKIAQTVLDSIQNLPEWCFGLCGCRSCLFNICHILLPLLNHGLCVLNSSSCHRGLSIHMILDPFPFFFIA